MWTKAQMAVAITNHRTHTLGQLAQLIGKKPKTISRWLLAHGHCKRPRYLDTEAYMLENFVARQVKVVIDNRTINALKIKRHRLLNPWNKKTITK